MLEKITQAFALTQALLRATEQQDWDEVAKLQAAREQLTRLADTLPIPDDDDTSQRIGELIIAIQKMDAQILPLLVQQKQALIKESQQTNKGRKMHKAYKGV